eukprot:TRINITY_DN2184_c0_g1_i2.p1 TRINITY_DN2184_c0_g1~~TRINITY_DN2184_c0_g1_i2.p1  ORF type:complete len:901 (-),score=166.78 TRINITY_DN2184_c0_g1_i2:203-2905(-)
MMVMTTTITTSIIVGGIHHSEMDDNQLSGPIPRSIYNLTELRYIDLSLNLGLTGPLYSEIGQWKEMQFLYMYEVSDLGPIPPEMKELTKLLDIGLFGSGLTGTIPDMFSGMRSLRRIGLFQNKLTGAIPKSIGMLENVTEIGVHLNNLDEIPEEIGNLSKLLYLYLDQNHFTQWPPSLKNLTNLQVLNMRMNNLSCENYTPLESCWDIFGHLNNLEHLDLGFNRFNEEFPEILFRPERSFRVLVLSKSGFYGSFPIRNLRDGIPLSLVALDISANNISKFELITAGTATSFHHMLTFLGASDCGMEGEIPPYIFFFSGLMYLDMAMNKLHGTVDALKQLPMLSDAYLSQNPDMHHEEGVDKWIRPTMTEYSAADLPHICYDLGGVGQRDIIIKLDDSYFDYQYCFCPDGSYGKPPHCKNCLENAICPGYEDEANPNLDRVYLESGNIYADVGYWATPPFTVSQQEENAVYPTHMISCTSGNAENSACRPDKDNLEKTCRTGYEDRLCSKCSHNYFSFQWTCRECPTGASLVFYAVFVGILIIGVFIASFILGASSSGYTKILIFYLQVTSYIRFGGSPAMETFVSGAQSIANLKIAGPECVFSHYSFLEGYIMTVLTPPTIALLLTIVFFVGKLFGVRSTVIGMTWGKQCLRSFVFMFYLVYMSMVVSLVTPLACEKDPGMHKEFMINLPYHRCLNTPFLLLAILALIVYGFVFPIVIAWCAWKFPSKAVFGLLFACFQPKRRAWEAVITLRRILFAFVFLGVNSRSVWQAFLWGITLVGSFLLQMFFEPYRSRKENILESISLGLLTLEALVSLKLDQTIAENQDSVDVVLFLINIVFIFILVVLMVWNSRVMRLMRSRRSRRQKFNPVLTSGGYEGMEATAETELEKMSQRLIQGTDM